MSKKLNITQMKNSVFSNKVPLENKKDLIPTAPIMEPTTVPITQTFEHPIHKLDNLLDQTALVLLPMARAGYESGYLIERYLLRMNKLLNINIEY
jgi:hypothetical protein